MKVYIAGRISGTPDFKERFAAAERWLEQQGFTDIFNPAAKQPEGLTYKEYIDRDLKELMGCDAIYLMPDWEESKGARLEKNYALTTGMVIIESVVSERRD